MKTKKLILFYVVLSSLCLLTCKKVEKEMLVSTGTVSNIMMTTADVSGKILDLGEGVSAYGHCYGTSPNTTVSGPKTEISVPASVRSFTSNLTGLMPGTKYYVTSYCRRGQETVYGDEINFTTLSDAKAVLTTAEITSVDKTSAVSGGNVTNQGGTPVTARGVCYSLAVNPTIDNDKVSSGSGTGIFSCNLTLLTADKKYYVRAYATNMGGTAYGEERNFTTLPDVPIPPTITTAPVSSKTTNSAVCGGEVTSEGTSHVTARGVCYSTDPSPDINDNKTTNGEGLGVFVSDLTLLTPGTTYYVRAYATNSINITSYGNEVNFKTNPVPPTLTTTAVTLITYNSARSGGNITSDGGAPVLAYGVCWSTSQNPDINSSHTTDGSGITDFTSNISGLLPTTEYYVRAYATNDADINYGNQQPFTTAAAPYIAITSPTSEDHWLQLQSKEIKWNSNIQENVVISLYKSDSPIKTIVSSTINDGSYIWILTSDLIYGNDYKIRISSVSNSNLFGESSLFKISEPNGTVGIVSDYEGNSYSTVKIGNQWWMSENLRSTRYSDIFAINLVTGYTQWAQLNSTYKAYCYYNNNTNGEANTYGALYTWAAAMNGQNSSSSNPSGVRGVCPVGWHLPSDAEWAELASYLASNTGGKLKEAGTTHWLSPNAGATNESGFKALPGGQRYTDGYFEDIGQNGYWWTSTGSNTEYALMRYLSSIFSYLGDGIDNKKIGMSVRCVKD
jgi:uncharacterized protein (TIGR02145 family)